MNDICQAEHADLERVGYGVLQGLDVARKAINDATGRGGLEKVKSAAQYGHEQLAVVNTSGSYAHAHEEYVRDVDQGTVAEPEQNVDVQAEDLALVGVCAVQGLVVHVVTPRAQPEARRDQSNVAQQEKYKEENAECDAGLFNVIGQNC